MIRLFSFFLLLLTITTALAQSSLTSDQLYAEAVSHFKSRDYTAASASLDKIPTADQNKADILNLRGAIYKRLGELDNAANAYTDALKASPKDWVPKYNIADIEFLRQQYKPSRSYLEQALASMPEADRVQKQDLILYKVYLTYLLEGDNDKAKLLLENFDQNSANPVFYYAQAAWSYKNKENDKAATWIESTQDLYSEELRNSYSQALVDLGWVKPTEGIGTTLTASATPEATPTATPGEIAMADIVPLSTSNATPIPVISVVPAESPAETAPAAVSPTAIADATAVANATAVATGEPGKEIVETEKKRSIVPTLLIVLAIFAVAGLFLVNLAKKTRIVPAPTDNTGYDAIAATSSPETAELGGHRSEGTGHVIVQESETPAAAAPIKVTPIQREYDADTKTATTSLASSESAFAAPASKITRKVTPPASSSTAKTATKAPVKTPASALAKAPAKVPAKTPVKPATAATAKTAVKTPATKTAATPAKAPAKPASKTVASVSPAKSTAATAKAPVIAPTPATTTAPTKKVAVTLVGNKPSPTPAAPVGPAKTVAPKKPAPAAAVAPKAKPASTVETTPASSATTTASPATAPVETADIPGLPKGAKVVPIVTENFPLPDGGASLIDLPIKVEPIVLSTAKKPAAKISPKPADKPVANPAVAKPAPLKKTPVKPATAATKPTPVRPVAPLITIPEFEDDTIEIKSQPLRLIPNEDAQDQKTS